MVLQKYSLELNWQKTLKKTDISTLVVFLPVVLLLGRYLWIYSIDLRLFKYITYIILLLG